MDDAARTARTTPARERSDQDTQATARATLMLAAAFAEHLQSTGSVLVASVGAARDLLDALIAGQTVDRAVRFLLIARLANIAAMRVQHGDALVEHIEGGRKSCWELVVEKDVPALVASVTAAWAQIRKMGLVSV